MTEARGRRAGLILSLIVMGTVAQAQAPVTQALPDAEGADIVRARCLTCHNGDIIAGQRLTEAGWGREIDKMIRWGARVPDQEREGLHAYLATHFAPRAVAAPEDTAGGKAVFERACLACHGIDLVESQRLSPAGWTREVEKMTRWGARVSETDKAALVGFLASRYPVR